MMTDHTHPNPIVYRLGQLVAAALLCVMLLTIPLQVLLAVLLPGGLLVITALMTLLLVLPVVMFLSVTPPLELREDGIFIRPWLWKDRLIPWDSIQSMRPYPLLPQPEQESVKRVMVGRRKYQAAVGHMLCVVDLPLQYRVAGLFVGEGWRPIIAVTNRTHSDYDKLIKRLQRRVPAPTNDQKEASRE